MIVLGIESTCDETSAALVEDGKRILSHVVLSQAALHEQFNGVYPEIASREHEALLLPAIQACLSDAGLSLEEIDLIAVAQGPGLMGSLIMGMTCAKTLSLATGIPLIGIDHVHAHLYGAMMSSGAFGPFPALGLVISGGHTLLAKLDTISGWSLLSDTVDDAVGEAFDKVATLMGLPYPGGPHIEKLAAQGNPHRYPVRAGKVKEKPLHFSFSGLKTAVLQVTKGEYEKADLAASFQRAAFDDILAKSLKAAEMVSAQAIFIGGGVSCNQTLQKMFNEKSPYPVFWPHKILSLDNAAMIAGMAFHEYQQRGGDPLTITPYPRIISLAK